MKKPFFAFVVILCMCGPVMAQGNEWPQTTAISPAAPINSPVINGGTIDGASVGATTPAAVTGTQIGIDDGSNAATFNMSGAKVNLNVPLVISGSSGGSGISLPNNAQYVTPTFGGDPGIYTLGGLPCYKYMGYHDTTTFDYDICDGAALNITLDFLDGTSAGTAITETAGSYQYWLYTEDHVSAEGRVFTSATEGRFYRQEASTEAQDYNYLTLGKDASVSALNPTKPLIIFCEAKLYDVAAAPSWFEHAQIRITDGDGGFDDFLRISVSFTDNDGLTINSDFTGNGVPLSYNMTNVNPTDGFHTYLIMVDESGDYEIWYDGEFLTAEGYVHPTEGENTALIGPFSSWADGVKFQISTFSGAGESQAKADIRKLTIIQP